LAVAVGMGVIRITGAGPERFQAEGRSNGFDGVWGSEGGGMSSPDLAKRIGDAGLGPFQGLALLCPD